MECVAVHVENGIVPLKASLENGHGNNPLHIHHVHDDINAAETGTKQKEIHTTPKTPPAVLPVVSRVGTVTLADPRKNKKRKEFKSFPHRPVVVVPPLVVVSPAFTHHDTPSSDKTRTPKIPPPLAYNITRSPTADGEPDTTMENALCDPLTHEVHMASVVAPPAVVFPSIPGTAVLPPKNAPVH